MRLFQRTLLGFNNLWIHFIFREFNCVSMSKIRSPLVQMERGLNYVSRRWYFFPAPEEIYIKESLTLFQIWIFFAIPSLILSHFDLSRIELPKLTPSILIEIFNISFALVDQFYFYMRQLIRLDFLKSYLWARCIVI